jgi:UPF0755 protein
MLKFIARLLMLGLLVAIGMAIGLYWFAQRPLATANETVEFNIQPGSGLRSATQQMKSAGIHLPAWPFIALARVQGKAGMVKAGSYELNRGATAADLLRKITRGEFAYAEVLFVEGWNFKQMRAALAARADVRHDTAGLSDAELMRAIGAPVQQHPEGRFFPDTYRFAKGASDMQILREAYQAMDRQLASAWATRAPDLPFANADEALILASIVEKETGQRGDRPLIAAVFINRLRRGIMLQTDPTVIYGMGERFSGDLRRADLSTDTPYNTYMRAGLPPTPIAMPGIESIQAVLHPADSDALYFVARGDGSSHFSRSLNEHNRAVDTYQRTHKKRKK